MNGIEQTTPTLDTRSGVPIYRQIVDWVRLRISAGILAPGDQLPTVRQMAVDLEVNANTIARAYLELEKRGDVNALRGRGTFVSNRSIDKDEVARSLKLREILSEFLSRAAELGFSPEEIAAELADLVPARGKEEA